MQDADRTYQETLRTLREAAARQGVTLTEPPTSQGRETDPQTYFAENMLPGDSIQNVSHHSTPRTQQPPQPQPRNEQANLDLAQIFAGMADAFRQAINNAQGNANPGTSSYDRTMHGIRNSPMHTFHGLEHESANAFIYAMEEHFRKNQINDDTDRLIAITSQLKGPAKDWYEPHKNLIYDYSTFKHRLRQNYDTIAKRAQAEHTLHTKLQGKGESASLFIAKKIGLFNRVDPTRPALEKAHVIYRQLLPEVRAQIRVRDFENPEELMQVASEVEENLRIVDVHQWRGSRSNNGSSAPQNTGNRPTHNNNQHNTQNGNSNRHQQGTGGGQERPPPTACRFCGEWHWNRQCPRNPVNNNNASGRQQQQQQPQQQQQQQQSRRQTTQNTRSPENPQGAGVRPSNSNN